MIGKGCHANDGGQSEDSSISLGCQNTTTAICCGVGCDHSCGCHRGTCTNPTNTMIGNGNTAVHVVQGGYAQQPVAAHAILISPANNLFTMQDSFPGFHLIADNSYEAHLPTASPLTHDNVHRLNEKSGGQHSHKAWLAQHYEDVDNDPNTWFNSVVEPDGFDAAGTIEAEGMEDSPRSLHVGHDLMDGSISMLSQYTSSFSRPSTSPSIFLPEMRRSLVYQPLPLVPEYHHMALPSIHDHLARDRDSV